MSWRTRLGSKLARWRETLHATFFILERHPRLRMLSRKALENGIFYKKLIQVLANALLVLAIAK